MLKNASLQAAAVGFITLNHYDAKALLTILLETKGDGLLRGVLKRIQALYEKKR